MHPVQRIRHHSYLPGTGSKNDGFACVEDKSPRTTIVQYVADKRAERSHSKCSVASLHTSEDCSSPPACSGTRVESSPDLLANYAQTSLHRHTPAASSALQRASTTNPARQTERTDPLVVSKSHGYTSNSRSSSLSRSLQFVHQQKHLQHLERQEEEIPQDTPARREVYVKKVSPNALFGADIIKIDDDFFVAKVYETMDMGGEKSAAYRIGLSFGDRIVSINKLAVGGFPDLQHLLDTTQAMTVEFLAQPWFVNCRVKVTKDHKLEGMKMGGHSVLELERGSYVDKIGVHKGFALVGVEGESVLGESDAKVEGLMNHFLHSKRTHLSLMFTRESAWQTLVRGIELVLSVRKKNQSVSKYVSHSLHMDRSLKDPNLVDRVDLGEMQPKGRGRFFRRH